MKVKGKKGAEDLEEEAEEQRKCQCMCGNC